MKDLSMHGLLTKEQVQEIISDENVFEYLDGLEKAIDEETYYRQEDVERFINR